MAHATEKKLRAALQVLLPLIDAIEADDWGLDATRDLRAYTRETLADLDSGSLRTGDTQAFRRLGRLGSELQLHSWAELWRSVPAWKEPIARAEEATRALHEDLHNRSS
jgi:hypothetical protein